MRESRGRVSQRGCTEAKTVERLRAIVELFAYLWHTKRFLMLPLVLALALLGLMLIVSEASVVAPFLYPLY